jgi:hypothetical protein
MTDQPLQQPDETPTVPVGPEPTPPDSGDTSVRPEDGEQPQDQDPNYEVGESDDNEEDNDPEVGDV